MLDTTNRQIRSIRSIGKSVPKILRKSLRWFWVLRSYCEHTAAFVSTGKHYKKYCGDSYCGRYCEKGYIKKNIIKFSAVSELYLIYWSMKW